MPLRLAQQHVDDVRRELARHRRTQAHAEAQALELDSRASSSSDAEAIKARARAARAGRDAAAPQQKVYAAEAKLRDELRREARRAAAAQRGED